jgi:endonuclease III related protein
MTEPISAERLRTMYDRLVATYGPRDWWPAQSAFEVVIGAYLTQSTAWTSVERSIANLHARHLLHVDALRALPEEELRELIRPSGYMIRKAAAIKSFIAFLDTYYDGSLEKLSDEAPEIARPRLLALPGVGSETADAILLYALGQPAMVVDEYLRRVVVRHGLIGSHAKYAEIQQLAVQAFAEDDVRTWKGHFNEFHALIVEVGKRHCRRAQRCEECPLAFDLNLLHDKK